MKTLIAYYSRTGNTARVAKDLATQLGADLEEIVDKKNRSGIWGYIIAGRDGMKKRLTEISAQVHNPADYDLVILGSPVWGWDMVPAVRTYLDKGKGNFKEIALFVTSGNTDVVKIISSFESVIDKRMKASAGFNTVELKSETTYREKLAAFVQSLR
jgi:menaquinone-dependent protoporphyrinogen IX oxidase